MILSRISLGTRFQKRKNFTLRSCKLAGGAELEKIIKEALWTKRGAQVVWLP